MSQYYELEFKLIKIQGQYCRNAVLNEVLLFGGDIVNYRTIAFQKTVCSSSRVAQVLSAQI